MDNSGSIVFSDQFVQLVIYSSATYQVEPTRIDSYFLSSRDHLIRVDEKGGLLTITPDICYTEDTCVLLCNDDLGWGGGSRH
jgi:hypothetical protein